VFTAGKGKSRRAELNFAYTTDGFEGKEAKFQVMPATSQIETSVHVERHYAVREIAEIWNLSPDKVRELFESEPGVLMIGERNSRHKRRYVTLRIPHSVLERVHARLSSKASVR
jgi:hypothetical protein